MHADNGAALGPLLPRYHTKSYTCLVLLQSASLERIVVWPVYQLRIDQ
jgi:hypothetical protein